MTLIELGLLRGLERLLGSTRGEVVGGVRLGLDEGGGRALGSGVTS